MPFVKGKSGNEKGRPLAKLTVAQIKASKDQGKILDKLYEQGVAGDTKAAALWVRCCVAPPEEYLPRIDLGDDITPDIVLAKTADLLRKGQLKPSHLTALQRISEMTMQGEYTKSLEAVIASLVEAGFLKAERD